MKRIGIGLLYSIAGYVLAALAGYFLIGQFSSNPHDRSVEAAMTGAFVFGPFGAVVAFVLGYVRSGRGSGGIDSNG